MRSSKTRSRGKNNRNRPASNNINRVFESSGPEGKVRGTPQQIIDKYTQLTRDAQLGNDRVAAENFLQHAEHYARLLNDAQREAEARRAEQEAQQKAKQAQREAQQQQEDAAQAQSREDQKPREDQKSDASSGKDQTAMGFEDSSGDSGLVETPESSKPKKPRTRKPRTEKPAKEPNADTASKDAQLQPGAEVSSDNNEAAE